MSPVLANKLPFINRWKTPLDLGKKYKGKRILGANKTWRGLVFGTCVAAIFGVTAFTIRVDFTVSIELLWIVALASGLMGFGALVGDAVESFAKRRSGIKPGDSWFPFDQIDYILGGLLFSYPLIHWPIELMFYIFAIYFGLHVVVSFIGYKLGLKDKPI